MVGEWPKEAGAFFAGDAETMRTLCFRAEWGQARAEELENSGSQEKSVGRVCFILTPPESI